jgi:hypothetical protein
MRAIIFFLFLFAASAGAQDCVYVVNNVDEFTKKKKLETKWVTLLNSAYQGVLIKGKKSDDYIYFEIIVKSMSILSVSNGNMIKLMLTDGTIMTGIFIEYEIAKYNFTSKTYSLHTIISFPQDQVEMLSRIPIKTIRIHSNSGYIDRTASTKTNKFMQMIKCIL